MVKPSWWRMVKGGDFFGWFWGLPTFAAEMQRNLNTGSGGSDFVLFDLQGRPVS